MQQSNRDAESSVQRAAPRAPTTYNEAKDLLHDMEILVRDYGHLVTVFEIRNPAVAAIFQHFGMYDNNREMQNHLDRANALMDRVENSFGGSANSERTKWCQYQYDMLRRIYETDRERIDGLRDELRRRFPPPLPQLQQQYQQPPRHQLQLPHSTGPPNLPPPTQRRAPPPSELGNYAPQYQAMRTKKPHPQPSSPNLASAPQPNNDVVLRLRDENQRLRQENADLRQELERARDIIRRIQGDRRWVFGMNEGSMGRDVVVHRGGLGVFLLY